MRNFLNQDQKINCQNNRYHCSDSKDVPIVVHTQDWLKASGKPLVKGNVASQLPECNPLDYFMWSKVEREVNKHLHNTQVSQGQDLRGNDQH
jgi:hypothetical protein